MPKIGVPGIHGNRRSSSSSSDDDRQGLKLSKPDLNVPKIGGPGIKTDVNVPKIGVPGNKGRGSSPSSSEDES